MAYDVLDAYGVCLHQFYGLSVYGGLFGDATIVLEGCLKPTRINSKEVLNPKGLG